MFTIDRNLNRLAAEIAEQGFTPGAECEVALVIDRARRAGLDCLALDVLADLTEPATVRARAFGLVAVALARRAAATPDGRPRVTAGALDPV